MAEIFIFSTIEEKNEFWKFELQKIHKRQKGRYSLVHLKKKFKN